MMIYKATHIKNNKVSIGITTHSLESRKSTHKHSALSGKSKSPFHQALKEDWDSFTWEIIEQSKTWDHLVERELYWIEKYRTDKQNYGYNTHQTKFASRYEHVVPRVPIKIKIENEELLKGIRMLATRGKGITN